MANWGVLQGLGDGLQQAGNIWTEKAKAKLAEDLARQREDRREALDRAKEDRRAAAELAKVDTNASTVDLDPTTNSYIRTLRNSNYGVLGTAPVGTLEAESIRTQREVDQAKLRTQSLDAQLKELNVSRLPEKWAQEDAMHGTRLQSERALQAQRYASAGASNRRGLDSTSPDAGPVSKEQYANELVKEYKPAFDRAEVPAGMRDGLATMAVQRAAIDGTTPAQAMLELIREYREGAPREGASSTRRGTLLGN